MIELLVVIVLITLVTSFAIPAIRTGMYTDQLKAASRRLIGLVNEVSQDAVNSQSGYYLNFDLDKNQVWASPDTGSGPKEDSFFKEEGEVKENLLQLPESIRIVDVTSAHGGKSSGEGTKLYFSKKGYVDKTAIHLRDDDGREMTILLSPFMGMTRVFDSYIELEGDKSAF